MSMLRLAVRAIVAGGLTLAHLQHARAQATDPADLAFWQSIQNSQDPAEYQAYLDEFPNGRFRKLALNRAKNPPAAPAAPALAPIPLPPANGQAGNDQGDDDASPVPAITITPPRGHLGQTYTVGCVNIPPGRSDMIVVVPAGTPEMDPSRMPVEQTKIIQSGYTANCPSSNNTLTGFGPFPPGRYEFRWMTSLYNTESKLQMKAKAELVVR